MLCTTQEFLRDYPCVQRLHGLLPGAHCLHVASLPTTPKPKLAYLQLFISCISIRLAVLFYLSISPFIDYFLRTPHPYSGFLLLRIPFNCIRTDFHHILHLRHIYPTWTFNISYFQLHIQHYSCFLFLTNSALPPPSRFFFVAVGPVSALGMMLPCVGATLG